MKNDLYHQLVDLYAGEELSEEAEKLLYKEAHNDPHLAQDMASLRETVKQLHDLPRTPFVEESYQRILMKLYGRGVEIRTPAPHPTHIQYHLPMTG